MNITRTIPCLNRSSGYFLRTFSTNAHRHFYDKYGKVAAPTSTISIDPSLKLSNIFKTEKIDAISSETIAQIWSSHFDKKPFHTSLTVAGNTFTLWWLQRARENPMFIVPLSVGRGFCNFLVQHQFFGNCGIAAFATLDDYQRYGSAAPVRLAVNSFDDLLESKRIGLLMGKFDGDVLTREQSLALIQSAAEFYSTSAYRWVQTLNASPESFDYSAFLEYYRNRADYPSAT